MAWKKSPQGLIDQFADALPDDPRVERRRMFGYPCAFVNGNMFCGLHEDNLIVRLDPDQRAQALTEGGAEFSPMGRTMREYVALGPDTLADDAAVGTWLARGLAFAAALPPKIKKPPRKRAAKK